MKNKHTGSDFDDFLREQGILEECEKAAVKRVFSLQIAEAMKRKKISKSTMATRMRASRTSVDRLLDKKNPSMTLNTAVKAAIAVGKKVRMELIDS